jgi:hypothetical protein
MYAKTVDLFRSHKAWVGSFRDQVAPDTWRIACSAKDILAAIFSMVKKFIMAELISVSWERQLTRVRGMTTCSLDAQRRYWANGMEGGHVVGHDGVRNYWTRHWPGLTRMWRQPDFRRASMGRSSSRSTRAGAISTVTRCLTRWLATSFA